jgi:S1-C subfamily serine protease
MSEVLIPGRPRGVTSRRGLAGVLIVALGIAAGAAALSPAQQGTPSVERTVELHRRVARSTFFVQAGTGRGSGFLVDAQRRLVVTARHVVRDLTHVTLMLAQTDEAGDVITDLGFYKANPQLLVKGEVIFRDAGKDIAVIRLDKLPTGAVALPLASTVRAGQTIHLVGNSSVSFGGLFGYRRGVVAGVYRSTPAMTASNARIVETTVPSNHGDSGGPVVNDAGELVAFISEGTDGSAPGQGQMYHRAQVTDHSVHVAEVRAVLSALQQ